MSETEFQVQIPSEKRHPKLSPQYRVPSPVNGFLESPCREKPFDAISKEIILGRLQANPFGFWRYVKDLDFKPSTIYDAMKSDPAFLESIRRIKDSGILAHTAQVESKLADRAANSDDAVAERIFYLKSHMRSRYGDQRQISGRIVVQAVGPSAAQGEFQRSEYVDAEILQQESRDSPEDDDTSPF